VIVAPNIWWAVNIRIQNKPSRMWIHSW